MAPPVTSSVVASLVLPVLFTISQMSLPADQALARLISAISVRLA